jgi:hypothetical protein
MRSVGRHCVGQRTLIAIVMSVSLSATALPAHAEPTVTANDGNDVADQLDIRSATLSPESGDRSRITLRFWNDVPPELLEGRAIRMELSYSEDGPNSGQYVVGFFRNSDGVLRMVWGRGVQTAASWLRVGIQTTSPTRECFPSRSMELNHPPSGCAASPQNSSTAAPVNEERAPYS